MDEMNKDEIKVVKNSTIYEIRLMVDGNEKETYTKEEILKLLDTIAIAIVNEQAELCITIRMCLPPSFVCIAAHSGCYSAFTSISNDF